MKLRKFGVLGPLVHRWELCSLGVLTECEIVRETGDGEVDEEKRFSLFMSIVHYLAICTL